MNSWYSMAAFAVPVTGRRMDLIPYLLELSISILSSGETYAYFWFAERFK